MSTLGTEEAAKLLRMSPDALMRKARAGIVPADKPGRQWVFIEQDLLDWMRVRQKERACHCIASLRAPTGGSASQSAESRLDARLAQLTKQPQKNLRLSSAPSSGGRSSSGSGHDIRGQKRFGNGRPRLQVVAKSGTGSA